MLNKVTLIGRVGNDPEMKNFTNGNVLKFTLATSEKYKDKEDTQWHNILVWNKMAENLEKWIVKGKQLYIEGKITYNTYDKKLESGETVKQNYTEIHANNIVLLGSAPSNNNNSTPKQQVATSHNEAQAVSSSTASYGNNATDDDPADDLPF